MLNKIIYGFFATLTVLLLVLILVANIKTPYAADKPKQYTIVSTRHSDYSTILKSDDKIYTVYDVKLHNMCQDDIGGKIYK